MSRCALRRPRWPAQSLLLLVVALASCRRSPVASDALAEPPEPADLRVVLVTFSGLRADLLSSWGGDQRVTPHLAELERRADHVGLALATSTDLREALAALWTGRLGAGWQDREAGVHWTLPERFAQGGYSTTARWRLRWSGRLADSGLARGFSVARPFRGLRELASDLETVTESRSFLWVGVDLPGPPLTKEHRSLGQLSPWLNTDRWRELPERLSAGELEAAANASEVRDLYLIGAAQADRVLGRLVAQLEASDPGLRKTVLVVTGLGGLHLPGTPLGTLVSPAVTERSLGLDRRQTDGLLAGLVVPLVVLLPEDLPEDLRGRLLPSEQLVSHLQLLPTLQLLAAPSSPTVLLSPWSTSVGWLPAQVSGGRTLWLDPGGALRWTHREASGDRAASGFQTAESSAGRWFWSRSSAEEKSPRGRLPEALAAQLRRGPPLPAPAASPR